MSINSTAENKKRPEATYPRLRRSGNLVVLFSSAERGMVVANGGEENNQLTSRQIGFWSTWNTSSFSDYDGVVTLQNSD